MQAMEDPPPLTVEGYDCQVVVEPLSVGRSGQLFIQARLMIDGVEFVYSKPYSSESDFDEFMSNPDCKDREWMAYCVRMQRDWDHKNNHRGKCDHWNKDVRRRLGAL